MKKGIAFFDFDGTITTRDTMLELVKFHRGIKAFFLGMAYLSPFLAAMQAGFMSNQAVKEKFLSLFFKGLPFNEFKKLCDQFYKERLPQLIRPGAMKMINELKQQNFEVVIVSASAEQWVRPWTDANGLALIASSLETINGLITGKLVGNNCHGHEKVKRIKEKYLLSDFEQVHCFGDTKGDKPMLSLATHASYKPFRH